MDVKTTFLNGELEEEIYMEQFEGFIAHGQENKLCKLDKSLHGLTQASKKWHTKNCITWSFQKDSKLIKVANASTTSLKLTSICLNIDDMLIFGSNLHVINIVKSMLSANFDINDLEETNVNLGIKLIRLEKEVSLDPSHYIENILKKNNYFDCKPSTSYDPSVKLFKNTDEW